MSIKSSKEAEWANPFQRACLQTVGGLLQNSVSVMTLRDLEYGPTAKQWIERLWHESLPEADGYTVFTEALIGHAILSRRANDYTLMLGDNGEKMFEETAMLGELGARYVLEASGIEYHHFHVPLEV